MYRVEILTNGIWHSVFNSLPTLRDAIAIGLKLIRLGCNARIMKG